MSSILIRRANMVAAGSGPTPGRLPDGYTELAWIGANGTQLITISKKLSCDTDDVYADFYITDASAQIRVFGARTTTTNKAYALDLNGGNWRLGWGNSTTALGAASDGRHTCFIDHTNGSLAIDGIALGQKGASSVVTAYNAGVLAIRSNSTYYSVAEIRIYEFKVWTSGTLDIHLIPAMRDSDSEVGMYDIVNDEFLTNSGTGTFLYGTL